MEASNGRKKPCTHGVQRKIRTGYHQGGLSSQEVMIILRLVMSAASHPNTTMKDTRHTSKAMRLVEVSVPVPVH